MFAYLLEFPLDKWVDASTEKTSAEDCTATTINERREKRKVLKYCCFTNYDTLSLFLSLDQHQIIKFTKDRRCCRAFSLVSLRVRLALYICFLFRLLLYISNLKYNYLFPFFIHFPGNRVVEQQKCVKRREQNKSFLLYEQSVYI